MSSVNTGFKFGADPEIFLQEKGKPISAFGILSGTKENPEPCERGAHQVDGNAVEFNIEPTPSNDFEAFNTNIVTVMKSLKEKVKAKNPNATFNLSPTQDFAEIMDDLPEEAKELGCDPDYNAYTGEMNPTPDGTHTFRTAAGHVHVGWGADIPVDNPEHFEICRGFIKALDGTVGLFMTIIDDDKQRRELYGKAGAFRPKPYGVEYRTPSNVWLRNKDYRRVVHILMNCAIQMHRVGFSMELEAQALYNVSIESIINEGNKKVASELFQTQFFYSRYLSSKDRSFIVNFWENNMELFKA